MITYWIISNNDNIDKSCLWVKKLHLDKKANTYFAKNLINYKSVYWDVTAVKVNLTDNFASSIYVNSPDLSDCSKQSVRLLSRQNPNTSCFYPLPVLNVLTRAHRVIKVLIVIMLLIYLMQMIKLIRMDYEIAIIYAIILITSSLMQFENIYYGHEEKPTSM